MCILPSCVSDYASYLRFLWVSRLSEYGPSWYTLKLPLWVIIVEYAVWPMLCVALLVCACVRKRRAIMAIIPIYLWHLLMVYPEDKQFTGLQGKSVTCWDLRKRRLWCCFTADRKQMHTETNKSSICWEAYMFPPWFAMSKLNRYLWNVLMEPDGVPDSC